MVDIDLDIANKLTGKELKEYFKNASMKKYEKLHYAYVSVRKLIDFKEVLDKNESDYQDIINQKISKMKDDKIKASDILSFYMIIEICSFYEVLNMIKKTEARILPNLPSYYKILKESRGRVLAHLDATGGLKTSRDWMNQYSRIDEIGTGQIKGIVKVIKDFYEIYEKCKVVLGEDMS